MKLLVSEIILVHTSKTRVISLEVSWNVYVYMHVRMIMCIDFLTDKF